MKEELGKALGRIASGVYVVTIDSESGPHGMLATFVAQVAFEPPILTIAIAAQRPILNDLEGQVVTVNVLSKDNVDIFKAFARPSKTPQDDRFEGLNLIENPDGAIAFANVVSIVNCEIRQLVPAGDHVVAFAEATSGQIINGEAEPMIHLRRNGFQY